MMTTFVTDRAGGVAPRCTLINRAHLAAANLSSSPFANKQQGQVSAFSTSCSADHVTATSALCQTSSCQDVVLVFAREKVFVTENFIHHSRTWTDHRRARNQ